MGITVEYKCDRCQTVQTNDATQMWDVGIICAAVNTSHQRDRYNRPARCHEVMWCRKCVDEMQIIRPLLMVDTETKPPTIEDMIREIARQEQKASES